MAMVSRWLRSRGSLRTIDRLAGGHLRRFYGHYFIQGERWTDFFDAVEAEVHTTSIILDAGAGQGQHRVRFKDARKYVGVDLGVGDAGWNYQGLDTVADLAFLPFAQGSFDCILCVQVLEHVWRPHEVLCEMARVLDPGGCLFLSTSFMWPQHQKPYDGFRFSSFALRRLCADAGLEVEWLWPMGGAWTALHMALSNAIRATGTEHSRLHHLVAPVVAGINRALRVTKPLFFVLDRLDTDRDATLGFFLAAHHL